MLWHCLVLVGCALDRYVSILKPLHYESIITTKKVTAFNVITCIVCALYILNSFWFPQTVRNETEVNSDDNQTAYSMIFSTRGDKDGNNSNSDVGLSNRTYCEVSANDTIHPGTITYLWIWITMFASYEHDHNWVVHCHTNGTEKTNDTNPAKYWWWNSTKTKSYV